VTALWFWEWPPSTQVLRPSVIAAPDLGPVADNLPRGETSENLPPHIGPYDPPELTPEQLKEREELQRASDRIDRYLAAPRRVIVVSSTASTSDDPVKEAILRFVARRWPNIAPENIKPSTFIEAARNDEQFLKEIGEIGQLLGEADAFPSRYQIARALGRRE
jgi:hypothetical protein